MDLNKLRNEVFETAKAHGWHDEELPDETYLMLIITELAEAVQADRKGLHANAELFRALTPYNGCESDSDRERRFRKLFPLLIKNSVEDELADVVIRCLDMAGRYDIGFSLADEFLEMGMKEVNSTFPEVMYHICTFISSYEDTLRHKLNYCVAVIIGYCKQKGIDIEFFISQKMKYNKLRSFKHGNKKY